MNLLRSDSELLTKSILNMVSPGVLKFEIVLVPPFTNLEIVHRIIDHTDLSLGAQNVFWEDSGAFTGEISPTMLRDIGCSWVILGHSERRQILGETDFEVKKKVLACLSVGLKVVVCVGETLLQRNKGMAPNVLRRQVESALQDVNHENAKNVVIAYEPIWAIGTGNNAPVQEIEVAHDEIRDKLIGLFGKDADNIRIIYGGSVNQDNLNYILSAKNVNGALVGGVSLNADAFIQLIEKAGE
jgi:triosephosphate isomerase